MFPPDRHAHSPLILFAARQRAISWAFGPVREFLLWVERWQAHVAALESGVSALCRVWNRLATSSESPLTNSTRFQIRYASSRRFRQCNHLWHRRTHARRSGALELVVDCTTSDRCHLQNTQRLEINFLGKVEQLQNDIQMHKTRKTFAPNKD
jgi:hypothetical protein